MPLFDVEVEFTGKVHFEVEAEDRDDAAWHATNTFETCDKGRLALGELEVTGTFAETMTGYEVKELKHANEI
jgi:hypothetical protein